MARCGPLQHQHLHPALNEGAKLPTKVSSEAVWKRGVTERDRELPKLVVGMSLGLQRPPDLSLTTPQAPVTML